MTNSYNYKWLEPLINYCSDPFNNFPSSKRKDREFLVRCGLVKYTTKKGNINEETYIDFLVDQIKIDYPEKKDAVIFEIRSNIAKIIESDGAVD